MQNGSQQNHNITKTNFVKQKETIHTITQNKDQTGKQKIPRQNQKKSRPSTNTGKGQNQSITTGRKKGPQKKKYIKMKDNQKEQKILTMGVIRVLPLNRGPPL